MPNPETESTQSTIGELLNRQGGGLFLEREQLLDVDYGTWLTAANIPNNFRPFSISIYDSSQNQDVVTLILMVNPKDINLGQAFIANNVYTRVGWITTLWGRQQMTLSFSGTSPGFYVISPEGQGGLTNFNRRASIGFYNFMSLVSLFKNNAYYFLNSNNATIFKDGTSRVISVMDSIKIEYDGSTYLGSFSTFSMTDTATMPYRIEYNLEFVVSSIGADLEPLEGHVKNGNNYQANDISIAVQGSNVHLEKQFDLSEEELDKYFEYNQIRDEINTSGYLRGGGEEGVYKRSKAGYTKTVNTVDFLKDNPKVASAVAQTANIMGLTQEQLASIITFESAGTWSPTMDNPNSTALGIGQWINAAAQNMAPRLVNLKIIKNKSQCSTSEELVSIFNTTDKQVGLFALYADTTHVPGGKTLLQAMQEQKTPEDRFNTYMMGHFYPDYVGKDLDTPFPPNIQAKNPNIRTPRDYIRKVTKIMNNMRSTNTGKLNIVESPTEETSSSGTPQEQRQTLP